MARILTILAIDPEVHQCHDTRVESGSARPVLNDGNVAIKRLAEKLPSAKRACSVRCLALLLAKDRQENPSRPDIIQILGHGAPGVLFLGYYWNHRYNDKTGQQFYMLDSNPYAYGMLHGLVDKSTEVWLLGCSIGDAKPAGNVANGPTLLFALQQMWGNQTWAFNGSLNPDTAFVDGQFVGTLVSFDGKERRVGSVS